MSIITPEQWRELNPYLDDALELRPEERRDWLKSMREKDVKLASLLESLLDEKSQLEQERFLENCPLPVSTGLAGQTIGAYTLLSQIGQGGMGTVWLARRSDGRFERRAAVKFVSMALAGGATAARFKREGSILGRLTHPHIADLLDAGVTPDGQPYLVLEYVDGQPIDQYCDEQKLDVDERIQLFLDVLGAVAHAHANLIVHRDIKPSNVLVSSDGEVKLLDFGIAKLLEGEGQTGAATLLTHESGSALTPQFAAPEQLSNQPVTTTTDVYALGVVLYLLLTGCHPAGPGPHSPAELMKAVLDAEPKRASDAIGISEVAEHRRTSTDKLRRQLRGDLDTIVAKALKKIPAERYGSVSALADDLRRYLKHEPIRARPDSFGYRTTKFVRRNRMAVALASLAMVAVITGVTGTMIQARTARRERDAALRERDRANRVTDFMTGMFKVSDPSQVVGNGVTAREILDKASKDIHTGLTKDPELQAQMMQVMGDVYENLGLYEQAEGLLAESIQISRSIGGAADPVALVSMDFLGNDLNSLGRPQEAEKLHREALRLQMHVLGPDHPDTLMTLSDLATSLAEQGRLEEAEKVQREALEKQRRVFGVEDRHTIATMDNLAATLGARGKYSESEQLEDETITLERRVYGPDHLGVLNSMTNQGDNLYFMGRYAEAQAMWRQTLDIELRVLGPNHPATATSTYDLGCLAALAGRRDDAFALLNQAVDHLSPRLVPDVPNDPALNSLHADPRFAALVKRAEQRHLTDNKCPL